LQGQTRANRAHCVRRSAEGRALEPCRPLGRGGNGHLQPLYSPRIPSVLSVCLKTETTLIFAPAGSPCVPGGHRHERRRAVAPAARTVRAKNTVWMQERERGAHAGVVAAADSRTFSWAGTCLNLGLDDVEGKREKPIRPAPPGVTQSKTAPKRGGQPARGGAAGQRGGSRRACVEQQH